jgi:hypothetical protein
MLEASFQSVAGHSDARLATRESTNKRIVVHAGQGIEQDSISKTTNAKRAGGVLEQAPA